MADPITAGILLVVGAGLSAASSIMQGNQAKAQADAQAELLDTQAQQTRLNTVRKEALVRRQGARQRGAARAAIGATGLLTSGSTLDALVEDKGANELDALTVRYDGLLSAYNISSQAELTRYQGRAAKKAGYIGALTTVASSAATAGAAGFFSPASNAVASTSSGLGSINAQFGLSAGKGVLPSALPYNPLQM